MKKILSIALVAILAAGSAFATFSGNANVALGYNWETKAYGFSNGTGFDFDIDLTTADAEKIAEGSVYAGIKASMAVKLANTKAAKNEVIGKAQIGVKENPNAPTGYIPVMADVYKYNTGSKGTSIWQKDGEAAGLGVFFAIDEAYVAGEGWKLDIAGTQGAPDFAKSAIDTKKDAVKDAFGNQYDTKDVPVSYKVAAKDTAGVTLTVADWKASAGFEGSNDDNYTNPGKYWREVEYEKGKKGFVEINTEDTEEEFKGKYFNYNAFLQTPEFDFDVVSFQAAVIASRNENAVNPTDRFDTAIGASAKVGFDADIVTGSVAADYGVRLIENPDNDKYIGFHGLDIAANLAISPITLDVYFSNLDLSNELEAKDDSLLGMNFLSAQVKADLAAFDIPVALTVYGKNMLAAKGDAASASKYMFDKDGQDFGGKVAVNFGAIEASVDGGFVCSTEKLYLGADVAYKHDLFTAKAGIDWSIMTAADEDNNVLALSASVESSAIIPGATLSLTYGAADEDMNLLDKQINSAVKAQNLGKVEAKCKIEF